MILLLVPSLNPDGQILETNWYRKYRGTRWEGGRMPWLYHHYVGHDNNRDWFMLTQKETRNLTRVVYHDWLPQLFVDEHQMGSAGPRIFIPPYADPIDPDVHPLIWRELNLIGAKMAYRLEQRDKAGAISGYSYDGYWLGGTRNTGWWKNITGMLIEIASARMATPVLIEPTELEGRRQGAHGLPAAGQLSQPLAGRLVAPARHHGLRPHRVRRPAGGGRRSPRRFPARLRGAGPGRGGRRPTRARPTTSPLASGTCPRPAAWPG